MILSVQLQKLMSVWECAGKEFKVAEILLTICRRRLKLKLKSVKKKPKSRLT